MAIPQKAHKIAAITREKDFFTVSAKNVSVSGKITDVIGVLTFSLSNPHPTETTGISSMLSGMTISPPFPTYFKITTPVPSPFKSYSKSEAGETLCANTGITPIPLSKIIDSNAIEKGFLLIFQLLIFVYFYSSQTAVSTVLLLRIKIIHVDVLIIIKLTIVPPVQVAVLQRSDFVYNNGIFKIAAGRIRMFALLLVKQID